MTGLIYVAIIAVWAIVLVPAWLRSHDHLESRSVDPASEQELSGRSRRRAARAAAQQSAEDAARKAMVHGLKNIDVFVKGPGAGREAALRSLQAVGLNIRTIRDVTPIPHNGCRQPKRRRV